MKSDINIFPVPVVGCTLFSYSVYWEGCRTGRFTGRRPNFLSARKDFRGKEGAPKEISSRFDRGSDWWVRKDFAT